MNIFLDLPLRHGKKKENKMERKNDIDQNLNH
jgi:hypothetical protein